MCRITRIHKIFGTDLTITMVLEGEEMGFSYFEQLHVRNLTSILKELFVSICEMESP